jgi:hypothetical protein
MIREGADRLAATVTAAINSDVGVAQPNGGKVAVQAQNLRPLS